MNYSAGDAPNYELNLLTHRVVGASVWDRRGWNGTKELALTRWLIGVGGSAIAVEGVRRRGLAGAFLAGFGGTLVWWAMTSEGDLATARRWFGEIGARHGADLVHESSADSFPASDAPSFTGTVGPRLRRKDRFAQPPR